MFSAFRIFGLFLAVAVSLGACATPDPVQRLPEVTFQHLTPLQLAVGNVEVINAYQAPLTSPNVEHKLDIPPANGLTTWANDRLKPAGSPQGLTARFTIDRAAIKENSLPRTEGIKGAFTTDQAHRYELDLQATLELVDGGGQRIGHASARVQRNQTTPEDATLNDLHEVWFKLMEAGLQDFNREMEGNMRRFLAQWLR